MNQEYIIQKFNEILPADYKLTISDEFIMNFENVHSNKAFLIYVGDVKKLRLTNIIARLVFNSVELLLNPKFKLGVNNSTINININKHLFNTTVGLEIFEQLPINLTDDESVDKACELIKQYMAQDAIPFFNYWQDIRDFLPFLETDDNGIIANIFSGDGFSKKVIIWKLCSHPSYELLTKGMLKIFAQEIEESPNDKLLKKDYKKYLNLIKVLENTKPLYEWDDTYLIKKEWPSGNRLA